MIELGYVKTSEGPIHYRLSGEGTPIVLLHWAAASGRMYEGILPLLAANGFSAIALDLPGYGRSHRSGFGWPIERYANNVLEALSSLKIERFHLLGGHVGSTISVDISMKAGDRVDRLVLDGLLLLEPEEWVTMMQPFAGLSPTLDSDNHKEFPFELASRVLSVWNPDFRLTDQTLNQVYEFLNDCLEAGLPHLQAFASGDSDSEEPEYPLGDRLTDVAHQTLILSAEREPLSPAFERSLERVSGSKGHKFEGAHPLLTERHAEYARVITDFFSN